MQALDDRSVLGDNRHVCSSIWSSSCCFFSDRLGAGFWVGTSLTALAFLQLKLFLSITNSSLLPQQEMNSFGKRNFFWTFWITGWTFVETKIGELTTDALDISVGMGFRVKLLDLLPRCLTDGKVLLEEAEHAD